MKAADGVVDQVCKKGKQGSGGLDRQGGKKREENTEVPSREERIALKQDQECGLLAKSGRKDCGGDAGDESGRRSRVNWLSFFLLSFLGSSHVGMTGSTPSLYLS